MYNFECTDRFFLLIEKQTGEVIGATSPITLFFASPDVNKFENVFKDIRQYPFFGKEPTALYDRDPNFIKYLYHLVDLNKGCFHRLFPEVNEYIKKCNIKKSDIKINSEDYTACKAEDGWTCKVHNNHITLKVIREDVYQKHIKEQSDFVIKPTNHKHNEGDILPLILPNEPHDETWTYTTEGDNWPKENIFPLVKDIKYDKNTLPGRSENYPWLSIDDFFEDKIIKLPYFINTKHYWFSEKQKICYLLPLKPLFFEYFTFDDLKNKKHLIIEIHHKIIEFRLKIPVKKGSIQFSKRYSEAKKNIQDLNFHLSVFPFVKNDDYNLDYHVGILNDDEMEPKREIVCEFYSKGSKINIPEDYPLTRQERGKGDLSSTYYKVTTFDFIVVGTDDARGMVIPDPDDMITKNNPNKSIHYAIDFGTTNTHIAYQIENQGIKSFDREQDFSFWRSLLNLEERNDKNPVKNEETYDEEIFPNSVASLKNDFEFPVPTALVHNRDVKDFGRDPRIIGEVNNFLLYNKTQNPSHLKLEIDIKWNKLEESSIRNVYLFTAYIEYLLILIKYRSLMMDIDQEKIKITWMYPESMSKEEIEKREKIWKMVYERVFSGSKENNLNSVSESLCPYYYHRKNIKGKVLSIDVGGGSTDFAVFNKDESPEFASSIRFGGNALLGDGYSSEKYRSDKNGFVDMLINDDEGTKVVEDYKKDILGEGSSPDSVNYSIKLSNYLFSLPDKKFNYIGKLRNNNNLKPAFLTFFGSILYYSAILMKKNGSEQPEFILFSGNGSRLIEVIDPLKKKTKFEKFVKIIFDSVYGSKHNEKISVEVSPDPKVLTCEGALMSDKGVEDIPIKIWIGDSDELEEKYDNRRDYGNVNNEKIIHSIKTFFGTLDKAIDESNVWQDTNKHLQKQFQEERVKNIEDYLIRGINSDGLIEGKIEETLFFCPLIGVLNDLAQLTNDQ